LVVFRHGRSFRRYGLQEDGAIAKRSVAMTEPQRDIDLLRCWRLRAEPANIPEFNP